MSFGKLRIHDTVGRRAKNIPYDVRLIQRRLNKMANGRHRLKETGKVGPRTLAAIWDFQRSVVGFRKPDTRVDIRSKTIRALEDPASVHKWAAAANVRTHPSIYNP